MEEQNQNENQENKENIEEKKVEEAEPKVENAQPEQNPPPKEEEKKEENPPPKEEEKKEENQPQVENNQQQNEIKEEPNPNPPIVNENNNQVNNQVNQIVNNNQINAQINAQINEENKKKLQEQQLKKDEEKRIISVIQDKIKKLNAYYNFCLQYEDLIYKILYNLDELTYEKINNSLDDSFNYLYFFKNSADLYSKFAEQVQNSNKLITFEEKKPRMTDDYLSKVMQSTQDIFYKNLSKFSHGLSQNIIAKGPLSLLQEKKSKIDLLKKTQTKKFSELIDEKKKLEKKFKTHFKLFSSFVPELIQQYTPNNAQKPNPVENPIPELIDSQDFIYIIKDFLESVNSLLEKIASFTTEAKKSMQGINGVFVEVNNMIKESITIYIAESKIFFNQDVTKKFEEIENYFKKLEENAKENNIFKLDKIFHDQQTKENIYNLLQQYYMLLANSNTIKKELISDRNLFSIEKYKNINYFFDWLISVLPRNIDVSVDDLIIKKFDIKRDPGFFSKWKQAAIVFTRQHHLIVFDKIDSFKMEDIVKIFETDKISFRRKEDRKKGFLFEIIASLKGKIMNFKGDYLFDALSMENLNLISDLVNNQV